jgi:hypothetical protein
LGNPPWGTTLVGLPLGDPLELPTFGDTCGTPLLGPP